MKMTPVMVAEIGLGVAAAKQKILSRRLRLIKFLQGEADYRLDSLSSLTNDLAEAQGEEIAWIRASQAMTTFDPYKVRSILLTQVLLGSDDQWSGRGNEVKRAYADGFRGATKLVLRLFGEEY